MKKEIVQKQKSIRAIYKDVTPKYVGGGKIGTFVRQMQSAQRNGSRIALTKALAPLENEKYIIEAVINAIERAIIHLESYILKNS